MRDQKLLGYAKRLRTDQTPLEQKLWYALRAKRFGGAKFRRQVVIGRYIVDFACRIPRMLIVEVDGDTHGDREKYDAERTRFLEGKGYQVMRFTNREVGTNLDGVLTMIADTLRSPLSPTLSPEGERVREVNPLSAAGERERGANPLSPSGERVRERGTSLS